MKRCEDGDEGLVGACMWGRATPEPPEGGTPNEEPRDFIRVLFAVQRSCGLGAEVGFDGCRHVGAGESKSDGRVVGTATAAWYGPMKTSVQWNTGFESSYGMNGWQHSPEGDGVQYAKKQFGNEASYEIPVKTPIFAGCNWADSWPLPTDKPPTDLATGGNAAMMQRFCIARHGSSPVTKKLAVDIKAPLPGAINMVLVDGHVEGIRLENLWSLSRN